MFVIVNNNGNPVRDLDGKLLACNTAREAERFLMPGERVKYFELMPIGELGDPHVRQPQD